MCKSHMVDTYIELVIVMPYCLIALSPWPTRNFLLLARLTSAPLLSSSSIKNHIVLQHIFKRSSLVTNTQRKPSCIKSVQSQLISHHSLLSFFNPLQATITMFHHTKSSSLWAPSWPPWSKPRQRLQRSCVLK
jgi:hypothetical protein